MSAAEHPDETREEAGASWLEDVRQLITALQGTAVNEVEIRFGDVAVHLRRRPGVVVQAPAAAAEEPRTEQSAIAAIKAPLNGIYYDRPSPEADPFIQIGDRVEAGQVVAIIEAMKVFNEVHADQAGRVSKILAESGDMVQGGQDLIALDEAGTDSDNT